MGGAINKNLTWSSLAILFDKLSLFLPQNLSVAQLRSWLAWRGLGGWLLARPGSILLQNPIGQGCGFLLCVRAVLCRRSPRVLMVALVALVAVRR